MEKEYSRETESVCPVCLKKISATRLHRGDEVFLVKKCDDHGIFDTIIWRGNPSMKEWQRPKTPAHPALFYGNVERGCPFDCGLCEEHQQIPCSVLLEVTDRCNLHCAVCFADSGHQKSEDVSLEKIQWLLERAIAAAGPSNLQLSGGEPTLRNDLPEIVKIARQIGYSFIQINTNGLRLASDRDYVSRLQDAGLSSVFLQFDGVDDEIYLTLRGRALLDLKLQAVTNCGAAGIGVVLVPTLVRGVNTEAVGDIVRQGLRMAPTVRGIHFQPVSYFGRFPGEGSNERRFTLPELMRALEDQTAGLLKLTDFSPPGCEHAHCSFHATYMNSADGKLRPLAIWKQKTAAVRWILVQEESERPSRPYRADGHCPPSITFADSLPMVEESPVADKPTIMRTEEDLDLDVSSSERGHAGVLPYPPWHFRTLTIWTWSDSGVVAYPLCHTTGG